MRIRDQSFYRLPEGAKKRTPTYLSKKIQQGVFVLYKLASPTDYLVVINGEVLEPESLEKVCDADELLFLVYPQ